MRTQGIGVIFPPGVRQSYSHSQTVPLSPGVIKALRGSGRSENQHGSLILLAAELREGWGSVVEIWRRFQVWRRCLALPAGHLDPHPLHLCHNNQQEWKFQITIFSLPNRILSSNCAPENKEVLLFLGTWGTRLPGKCLHAYVFGPGGSKIIKQRK